VRQLTTPPCSLAPNKDELRENATRVAERVAHHAGIEFEMEMEKWFEKGVSKQHKSVGPIPHEVVPLLDELYAPYNDMLLKLILSNPFEVDKLALVHEFASYRPPAPLSDDELKEINKEMDAAADAAADKQRERDAAGKMKAKAMENKPPKGRNVPVPSI